MGNELEGWIDIGEGSKVFGDEGSHFGLGTEATIGTNACFLYIIELEVRGSLP